MYFHCNWTIAHPTIVCRLTSIILWIVIVVGITIAYWAFDGRPLLRFADGSDDPSSLSSAFGDSIGNDAAEDACLLFGGLPRFLLFDVSSSFKETSLSCPVKEACSSLDAIVGASSDGEYGDLFPFSAFWAAVLVSW